MADEEQPISRRRAISLLGIVCIGLPVLYVLSATPVFMLLQKNHWLNSHVNWQYVHQVYAPLYWLEANTFLKRPIDFYTNLLGL